MVMTLQEAFKVLEQDADNPERKELEPEDFGLRVEEAKKVVRKLRKYR